VCGQLSLGGSEPVRAPFALPPLTHNDAQLQFIVNSIAMPQRLKGTVTYVAKVTATATTHRLMFYTHLTALFSVTTQVSWYQKGKNQSGFY